MKFRSIDDAIGLICAEFKTTDPVSSYSPRRFLRSLAAIGLIQFEDQADRAINRKSTFQQGREFQAGPGTPTQGVASANPQTAPEPDRTGTDADTPPPRPIQTDGVMLDGGERITTVLVHEGAAYISVDSLLEHFAGIKAKVEALPPQRKPSLGDVLQDGMRRSRDDMAMLGAIMNILGRNNGS